MRYRVRLSQTVIEVGWIDVEASSAQEAETFALDAAHGDNCHWRFYETTGDIGVTTTEEKEDQ
jgi:hypothetical protein